MYKRTLLFLTAISLTLTLSALDLYVSPTRGNDANNGSFATPLKRIETAIFSVKDNVQTTIHIENNSTIVLNAILNLGDNKKVEIIGNNVILKASLLPAQKDPSGLPLTGQGNRILNAGLNCNVKIKGITFQNGRQIGYIMGGAICFAGKTLEVDSCRFIDNQAGSCGGAIGSRGDSVIVKNSYFEGNNILGGGARGAAITQCGSPTGTPGTLTVQNCTFYHNMTQHDGYGFVINIYDSSLGTDGGKYTNINKIEVTNCTFLENSSVTAYMAAIDISDGSCNAYLVNNTFYNNTDCAFRLGQNNTYLANNVIIGGKQGVMADLNVADGRPEIVGLNNIIVSTEGGINQNIDDACFTTNKTTSQNIVSSISSYPLSNIGLATSLSTDNFVPYLTITSASSQLIDAGTDNTSVLFGANYVMGVDTRGRETNVRKDIGAYEYNGFIPAPNGLPLQKYVSDDYSISQSGGILKIQNNIEKSFTLSLVNITGKVIFTDKVISSCSINKNLYRQGVYILLLNDGSKISTKKVIF
ncbi:MAG: T9SS type A sorting domain-containing protein [Bacteroidota bacterium]|nr:T9SS type A sorting domain-containing protein [Bacteroidota bacterium]